jgi:hypothetical protein
MLMFKLTLSNAGFFRHHVTTSAILRAPLIAPPLTPSHRRVYGSNLNTRQLNHWPLDLLRSSTAAGTTGGALLFQATSAEMIEAYSHAPWPHGTVIAADVFASGVLMSE